MSGAVLRILVFGLIAAASPLAFASTLVVLRSRRARLTGAIFAGAFLLGEIIVMIVLLAVGSIGSPGSGSRDTAASVLELVFGVLLLLVAIRVRKGAAVAEPGRTGRTEALLARLSRITPAAAFWAGGLLGVGGPRRLTIAIVTAATVSAAGLSGRETVAVVTLYVIVASLLVSAPVALYLVTGQRARVWLTTAETWLTASQRTFATVTLLVFGGILAVDSLVQLL
jgi:hypothetical protein